METQKSNSNVQSNSNDQPTPKELWSLTQAIYLGNNKSSTTSNSNEPSYGEVLFKMTDAYRDVWKQEDDLHDQRTTRFWLINAALFTVAWFIFKDKDFIMSASAALKALLPDLQNFHSFFGPFGTISVLRHLLMLLVCIFGTFNAFVFLHQLLSGKKATAVLYVRYKEFLLGMFSSFPEFSKFGEYVKNHNLSGMSQIPPIFGLYATPSLDEIQPKITIPTEGSGIRFEDKEDGIGNQNLLKDPFLLRGTGFLFVWLLFAAYCITYVLYATFDTYYCRILSFLPWVLTGLVIAILGLLVWRIAHMPKIRKIDFGCIGNYFRFITFIVGVVFIVSLPFNYKAFTFIISFPFSCLLIYTVLAWVVSGIGNLFGLGASTFKLFYLTQNPPEEEQSVKNPPEEKQSAKNPPEEKQSARGVLTF